MTNFKDLLLGAGLSRLMAAHNPLTARLVERAGFEGIWASGFELSAAYGLPDASLVSMTQHLTTVRDMAHAVGIPVVADIDTGYGNAINVSYAVQQYERAGAGAVVIEDKAFPKSTSLMQGAQHDLLRSEEFEGKISAAVDARKNPKFLIIARTEALIAGMGQDEARRRGERYADAGADAVLVHSRCENPSEVVAFASQWTSRVPLVLVPTAYPMLTEVRIRDLGKVGLVIYGNHTVRTIVKALEDVYANICRDGGTESVAEKMSSVEHVFELQGVAEMKLLEEKFLR